MTTGDTLIRRFAKKILAPLRTTPLYSRIQAWSMARDIVSGRFREPEIALLPAAVKAGDTVLDIGANFGLYSYHLSKLVGPAGRVISYEPIPFTVQTLGRVVRMLGLKNVEVRPLGVGEKPGNLTFTVPLQGSGQFMAGQAHIGHRNDNHGDVEGQLRWKKTTQVNCPVVALDEEHKDLTTLSFIKIDIEGAETYAFRGAKRLIERFHPTILIEINPWFLDGFQLTMNDLIGPFLALGYKIYRYDPDLKKLAHVADESTITEYNYLFIHPDFESRFSEYLEVPLTIGV